MPGIDPVLAPVLAAPSWLRASLVAVTFLVVVSGRINFSGLVEEDAIHLVAASAILGFVVGWYFGGPDLLSVIQGAINV